MTSSQRGLQVCLLLRVRGTAAQNWEQQRGVGNRGGGGGGLLKPAPRAQLG